MADAASMIAAMAAWMGDNLPKKANGDLIVGDPAAIGVAFANIAAPEYQKDIDAEAARADAANSEQSLAADELTGLRSTVDALRDAASRAHAQLVQGDSDGASLILEGVIQ